MAKEVHSIFRDILEPIKVAKTVEEAKAIIINRLEDSRIDVEDKMAIRGALNNKKTLYKVIEYAYDAVLKYEGCGVIK
jgi:tRNA 2-selenouridine synthase SelU